jgi:hypothetical protein
MIKPKRTAAEQVEEEAARKALNPIASRQTISNEQAEPEFQENHKASELTGWRVRLS